MTFRSRGMERDVGLGLGASGDQVLAHQVGCEICTGGLGVGSLVAMEKQSSLKPVWVGSGCSLLSTFLQRLSSEFATSPP